MAKKIQNGVGIYTLLRSGMVLSNIIMQIRETKRPIEMGQLLHGIYESHPLSDKRKMMKSINENARNLETSLVSQLKLINKNIASVNRLIKGLDFNHNIPRIKIADVRAVLYKRLKSVFEDEKAQKMSNELFEKSLSQIFQKPIDSIHQLLDRVESETYKDELKNIKDTYQAEMKQAFDICSIGYYSTSVFVAGRTVENAVNDYFNILFKTKSYVVFDLSETKFDRKIGMLNGKNLISEAMFHRLSTIRIERNDFAHPSEKILTKKQAHLRLLIFTESITEIEKSINTYQKKFDRTVNKTSHQ